MTNLETDTVDVGILRQNYINLNYKCGVCLSVVSVM